MAKYIWREKIYADISRLLIDKNPADLTDYEDGWTSAINKAIDMIKDAPAADIRPERHGRWISDDYQERDYDSSYSRVVSYKCSHCNKNTDWKMTVFCGNCGAKMDGKENTNE